ncbi:hypothetical protein TR2A62_3523 [Thalassobium sp. R2A62]|nr:hypothetical protein TR2A62_3523 [Thalassobium sp. R2A62]
MPVNQNAKPTHERATPPIKTHKIRAEWRPAPAHPMKMLAAQMTNNCVGPMTSQILLNERNLVDVSIGY